MLAITTTVVITVVKFSLALSLGLVGALSIVRFRAAIKEPEELIHLFLRDLFKISLNEIIHIKYRRSYLKHPSGIRLTLDRNLSYKLSNTNINKSLDFEVLEFKYDYSKDNYFRNYIFSRFSKMPIRLTKCSKYVEAITNEYS